MGVVEYTEKGKKLFPEKCQVTALANISAIHEPIE
jgi:hypothetical protein